MIVITGAAGFIGSRIATHLNEEGRRDLVLVDHLGKSEKWQNLRELLFMDYFDRSDFFAWLDKAPTVEAVIHMGACSSTTETDASYLMENNYRFTRKLAEWCLEHHVRFIYASSAATYGDGSLGYRDNEDDLDALKPLNMYGYSKQLFDQVAKSMGWLNHMAGLKFFNVYGPNEYFKGDMSSVVFKAFHQIREKGKVRLFKSHRPDFEDGGQLRDFIYVKDIEKVVSFILKNPDINGIYNLGTGKARSFFDLTKATFDALCIPVDIEYIDMPEHLQPKYQYYTQAEMEKLRGVGFQGPFTTLEAGVADYVQKFLLPRDSE